MWTKKFCLGLSNTKMRNKKKKDWNWRSKRFFKKLKINN